METIHHPPHYLFFLLPLSSLGLIEDIPRSRVSFDGSGKPMVGFIFADVVDGLYERHLHVYSWPGGELRQTLDLSNTRLIPLEEDGVDVTTNSLHPGTIATNIFRHRDIYATGFVNMLGKFLLRSVPQVEKYAKDEDLKVV